jgi:hypothetical protein
MRRKRLKSRRSKSTKVVLIKEITDHDPGIAAMLREGAEVLSRDGRVLSVLAEDDQDKKHSAVYIVGTYHCVFDNEWGNTRFFKSKRIEELLESLFEEE